MKTLLISLALFATFISGCATSAQNTWVCESGTCVPKQAMVTAYEKDASLQHAYRAPIRY